MKVLITSPTSNPLICTDPVDQGKYCDAVIDMTRDNISDVYVELTNNLSAWHNLMMHPVHISDTDKANAEVADINSRILIIMIVMFGSDTGQYIEDNSRELLEMIQGFDKEACDKFDNLEEHGAFLISSMVPVLGNDKARSK